jgi:hypothetical protein
MRRVIAAVMPMAALVVALGCGRSERRASDPSSPGVPNAIGGGPPVVTAPDAALTPTFALDAEGPSAGVGQ